MVMGVGYSKVSNVSNAISVYLDNSTSIVSFDYAFIWCLSYLLCIAPE